MLQVYGENCVSDEVLREWCRKFKDSRTDIHHEEGQGRKSVTLEDIVQQVDEMVREQYIHNCWFVCKISFSFKIFFVLHCYQTFRL